MSILSIVDFAKYDPDPINNVSMCANKRAMLTYHNQSPSDTAGSNTLDYDSCLIVTATAGTTSTPGVIFRDVSELIIGQTYYYTVVGWNRDFIGTPESESSPFLYVATPSSVTNIVTRTFIQSNNQNYWMTVTVNFVATSTEVNLGVLMKEAVEGHAFLLHQLTLSSTIPPPFDYVAITSDPYQLSSADSGITLMPIEDTPIISLPDFAYNNTTYTIKSIGYTFEIRSLHSDIYCSIVTEDNTGHIYSGYSVLQPFLPTPGNTAIITRANNRWVILGIADSTD